MKSILQDEKKCYVTGRTDGLELHHIYFGNPNRKISDKNGFVIQVLQRMDPGPSVFILLFNDDKGDTKNDQSQSMSILCSSSLFNIWIVRYIRKFRIHRLLEPNLMCFFVLIDQNTQLLIV